VNGWEPEILFREEANSGEPGISFWNRMEQVWVLR